jgi:hypothetical protein
VHRSVLDAVKEGEWDFEPQEVDSDEFDASDAMPGTREKLAVLADRIASGLPLWNNGDRTDLETPPVARVHR